MTPFYREVFFSTHERYVSPSESCPTSHKVAYFVFDLYFVQLLNRFFLFPYTG
jgi:hypothetical protein